MKERDIPPEAKAFEKKFLERFGKKKPVKDAPRVSRRSQYSKGDLAAGAEAEDRRDEVAESMRNQ